MADDALTAAVARAIEAVDDRAWLNAGPSAKSVPCDYQRYAEAALAVVREHTAAQGAAAKVEAPACIDAAHLVGQRAWSEATFGPGTRLRGVLDHIRKELDEIEADPADVTEWVDVVILALDGAWRAGWEPQQIIDAIKAKQARNEAREWPDWRTQSPDRAIEHVRAERLDAEPAPDGGAQ